MKISIKSIVFTLILILLVVLTGSFVFVRLNGKKIILDQLRQATGQEVQIEKVDFAPPLGVSLKDFVIPGYLNVKEIRIDLGVLNLMGSVLNQNVNLGSLDLIEPVVSVSRTKEAKIVLGDSVLTDKGVEKVETPPQNQNPTSPVKSPLKKDVSFFIGKLVIHKGQIDFNYFAPQDKMIKTSLQGVELTTQDICFPLKDLNSSFDLSAVFPRVEPDRQAGYLKGKGWINLVRKDMEGKFEIVELDGRVFKPYYESFSPEGVKSVTVSVNADLSSKNNDMRVKCLLKIKDLVLNTEEKKEEKSLSVDDLILAGLSSLGNKELVFNFNFNTKMDSFTIESIPFAGGVWNK